MANVRAAETRPPSGGDRVEDLDAALTVCDREPIHAPGAIQPHGVLLVARRDPGLSVVAAAGPVEAWLTPDWLDRPLAEVIGPLANTLDAAHADPPPPLGRLTRGERTFDVTAVRDGDAWLVQLEPVDSGWSDAGQALAWLDTRAAVFERTADLRDLCEQAAQTFRQLTGYARVMVYRFLDDDTGVVVAEARAQAMHSFLNHHFPATDIPRQARALYIRNRVRVIPDVGYTPAPLRPGRRPELAELDLSDVDLRSVSPIHVQYLKNMGVKASASISIVKDGVLWGLVACHHDAPRTLDHTTRLACRTLAGGLARQIRAKEEAETYRERLRLRQAEDAVMARLSSDADLNAVLQQAGEPMRQMMDADGFALLSDDGLSLFGACPDRDDVRRVAAFVQEAAQPPPVRTHRLGELLPAARAFPELASGLLALAFQAEAPVVMMWFRAEALQVVEWAGNPHKAVPTAPGAQLTPRASFAAWTEEVHGRSRPWSTAQVESVQRLARGLAHARQTRRIGELNRQLSGMVADKDRLLTQKEHLLREVNHRIQNSLQLVAAFLAMQSRAENDAALTVHLDEAQRRLSAVALVHRRLYSDDNVERVDLARYLEELTGEMKASIGQEWSEAMTLDLAPISVPADAAVNVGLILTELVINANKYAYQGQPGPLSIVLEQHRNRFRLIVADKGAGKAGAGKSGVRKGFGSRMVAAMVQSLDGVMEELDNQPGLRVIVTAPIGAA